MDVRVASAKLKALWRKARTCDASLYAANEASLRFGRGVKKRGLCSCSPQSTTKNKTNGDEATLLLWMSKNQALIIAKIRLITAEIISNFYIIFIDITLGISWNFKLNKHQYKFGHPPVSALIKIARKRGLSEITALSFRCWKNNTNRASPTSARGRQNITRANLSN